MPDSVVLGNLASVSTMLVSGGLSVSTSPSSPTELFGSVSDTFSEEFPLLDPKRSGEMVTGGTVTGVGKLSNPLISSRLSSSEDPFSFGTKNPSTRVRM